MLAYKGSSWSKWDLHVHTPDSIVTDYNNDWEAFFLDIEALPAEFKVIGINDYIFLDGYKKVVAAHENGRMGNILLFLPVIELRVDKFGGSLNKFSRVNYHIIFDSSVSASQIETQFLSALTRFYKVTPEFQGIAEENQWQAIPTRESLTDLGQMIIDSVPEEQKKQFGLPLIEGFNNFNVSIDSINKALKNSYFKGKYLTAVGKTEWADIKWTGQSIAEKKTIINNVDMVFISADTVENFYRSRQSLTDAGVNNRLIDCSDAHRFSDSKNKDRIGKCYTWIKSDPTFEGLKQSLHDFEHRIKINQSTPVMPPLRLERTLFKFPDDTKLKSSSIDDDFCYRGAHSVDLSPYLTCIIGGRGTGKSTYLNLLQEKSQPGSSLFFSKNKLHSSSGDTSISECVEIETTVALNDIEFLSQNSIEEFAMNSKGLTESVQSRLLKLDVSGDLAEAAGKSNIFFQNLKVKLNLVGEKYELQEIKLLYERELSASQKLVSSFASEQYKLLNGELSKINESYQSLISWKKRFSSLKNDIDELISRYGYELPSEKNPYSDLFSKLFSNLKVLASDPESPEQNDQNKIILVRAKAIEDTLLSNRKDKQAQLDRYLDEKGFSKENLTDVSNASNRISELREQLPQTKYRIEQIDKKIKELSSDLDPKSTYETAIREALSPINEKLQDLSIEVKPIALEYKWDNYSFNEAVVTYLYESISLIKDNPPRTDRIKLVIESIDLSSISDKQQLLENFIDEKKVSKDLYEFLSIDKNYEQFIVALEIENQNLDKHGAITISYDNRPIKDTSFGQRCTAAIVVLIMLGNTPLIIDEPEAHLDSSLIAKYLVELIKNVKVNRQLIFATHNANFVINGDAELIHILEINENRVATITSTSIENLKQRNRLLSLEGGLDAFQKRERRYK